MQTSDKHNPIFPVIRSLQLFKGRAKKKVVWRQITVEPAYTFMDYRAQGQTMEYLWSDTGTSPS
ncbi:uncharacterized protein EI90DRAFT_3109733, partial [Cantharellus anzutake]|uniref:uncharacterized protein n=1 Tax=Cantharellus anzutake TaxID=1750568 RepID=UPI001906470C